MFLEAQAVAASYSLEANAAATDPEAGLAAHSPPASLLQPSLCSARSPGLAHEEAGEWRTGCVC